MIATKAKRSEKTLTCKQRFLGAIENSPIDRPPVWLMRQAGRYLPAYQEVKKNFTFLEMCRRADAAAEVSIQPFDILGVDAIIVFNDILIPLEHMGQKVDFTEKGPVVAPAARNAEILAGIHRGRFDETPAVFDSIAEIRRRIGGDVPILGFAGCPFTLSAYMVEGVVSKSLRYIKELLYANPRLLEKTLDLLTETVIDYLRIQIKAGADAVQIFDTWAGELSRSDYRRFALPYQRRIIEAIQSEGTPVILYVKGSSHVIDEMKASGASVLSVDWRINLRDISNRLGEGTVLQGNLDPTVLYAPPETVRRMTQKILDDAGRRTGHIFNLGHGVLPETPVESVQALIETVKHYDYSSR
ncbi:MAG: uroporphyrinogen decarboxylase [Candidatus Omnitrophica bacterium]|nr:uroporphyrinogen decarboxylase [Candidatus Omnitrophota bacterium]